MIGLLASLPKGFLKTLTFDNGKEFALFKSMEQALGIKVYFAKPYYSWERGTNENRNGIVRKVLPKGRSFDDVTEEEMLGLTTCSMTVRSSASTGARRERRSRRCSIGTW